MLAHLNPLLNSRSLPLNLDYFLLYVGLGTVVTRVKFPGHVVATHLRNGGEDYITYEQFWVIFHALLGRTHDLRSRYVDFSVGVSFFCIR